MLADLKLLARRGYVSAYNFAILHAGLGQHDEAFRRLEKVEQDRSEWFAAVNVDLRLDGLRSDPRFARRATKRGFGGSGWFTFSASLMRRRLRPRVRSISMVPRRNGSPVN